MKIEDLAWLAGWLEGEGSFTIQIKPRFSVCISANTSDYDIAVKVATLLNTGRLPEGPRIRKGRKPIWMIRLARRSEVVELCKQLKPFMGNRRSLKISDLLQAVAGYSPMSPQDRGRIAGALRKAAFRGMPCRRCGCQLPENKPKNRGLWCHECFKAKSRAAHQANPEYHNRRAREAYAAKRMRPMEAYVN